MASERVGDMTIKELRELINTTVEQHLMRNVWHTPRRDRPASDVWESMLANIIKQSPNEPTALEMLREERDQWYTNT